MKNEVLKNYIINNISPRTTQRDRIKKLYGELKLYLGDDLCFQTGSYARFTAIRPVNDLDVFYIFSDGATTSNALKALPELAKKLENEFPQECSENFSVELQTHSVKLQFDDDFSIDVVPAVDIGKVTSDLNTPIYVVPDKKTLEWKNSDPKGYREITKQTDEASEGSLRRAIRFVKSWRKGCKDRDDDFKLKSFHIEQIFIEIFQENDGIELFDAIKLFYSEIPNNLLSARFEDRAYVEESEDVFIDEYVNELSLAERNQIINWSSSQLTKIKAIESAETEEGIIKIIEDIMSCSGEVKDTTSAKTGDSFRPSGQHST
ncbi:MAG: nucleotidyltransferase [Armatimonadetes bacterium]|nr:nucleotidyltransferase [Armatimonadota bacterium]